MKKNTEPVPITGRVFVSEKLADFRPSMSLPAKKQLQRGDVKLYSRPDKQVMHTLSGDGVYVPGIIQLSIFDGKSWRNLSIRHRMPETERRHRTRLEMGREIDLVSKRIRGWSGENVRWTDHTFYLPGTAEAPAQEPTPAPQPAPAATPDQTAQPKQLQLFDMPELPARRRASRRRR